MSRPSTAGGSTTTSSSSTQRTTTATNTNSSAIPTTYAFPTLPLKEIISILEVLCPDAKLQPTDFKALTVDKVYPLYEQLTEILFHRDRSIYQHVLQHEIPTFNQAISNNESTGTSTNDESIVELTTMKSIVSAIKACGVHDVSLRDIMAPDPVRTKKILCAYINFARYREDKLDLYQQFTQQINETCSKKQQLEVQNSTLSQQLKTWKEQFIVEEPQLQSLTAEVHTLTQQISQLKHQYEELQQWITEHTHVLQTENSELVIDTNTKLTLRTENERLQHLIVKDPEKLKHSISEMSHVVSVQKVELNDLSLKQRDTQQRNIQVNKLDNKLTKRIEMMNTIADQLQKLRKVQSLTKDQQQEISSRENELQGLQQEEQRLKKAITVAQERLFSIQKQFESKRTKAQLALEQVQQERQDTERELKQQNEKVLMIEATTQRQRAETQAMSDAHEVAVKQLRSKYSALANTLATYHSTLFKEMTSKKVQSDVAGSVRQSVRPAITAL